MTKPRSERKEPRNIWLMLISVSRQPKTIKLLAAELQIMRQSADITMKRLQGYGMVDPIGHEPKAIREDGTKSCGRHEIVWAARPLELRGPPERKP